MKPVLSSAPASICVKKIGLLSVDTNLSKVLVIRQVLTTRNWKSFLTTHQFSCDKWPLFTDKPFLAVPADPAETTLSRFSLEICFCLALIWLD